MTDEKSFLWKILKIFDVFKQKTDKPIFDEIARRAFVNNAFDGALTILGILMASLVVGEINSKTILSTGFGACLAMGISGSFGRYFSERAERKQTLRQIERNMFTDLSGSALERESKRRVLFISMIDGLSPALAAIVPLIPFFLIRVMIVSASVGMIVSFVLDFMVLFILGIFLGRISGENPIFHGILMVAVGFITSLIIFLSSIYFTRF